MPVRFNCTKCRQLLSVSSRKSGTRVACPKCGTALLVPGVVETASAPTTTPATKTSDQSPAFEPLNLGSIDPTPFEDIPDLGQPSPATQLALTTAAAAPDVEMAPIDRRRISIPRWVLYVQAALLLILVLSAFGMGYVIGRGPVTDNARARKAETQARTP